MGDKPSVPLAGIPENLKDQIAQHLQEYLVGLCASTQRGPDLDTRCIGSGTLARIGSGYFILTAAHVWAATRNCTHLDVALAGHSGGPTIPIDMIVPNLTPQRAEDQWGPDLALLQIPATVGSTIAAKMSFLDLCLARRRLTEYPPTLKYGPWILLGVAGEFSQVERNENFKRIEVHARPLVNFSQIEATHERGGFDYLDVGADLSDHNAPSSFGGVSGGGLWQIALHKSPEGIVSWRGAKYFHGVAFYQSPIRRHRRFIRCHGRTSVFEKAWRIWGLPN